MPDIVYEESCCCGSKIVVTNGIASSFDRGVRISAFVNKHEKCTEKTESLSDIASRIMASSPPLIDPDEFKLTQEERDLYGKPAHRYPAGQLVVTFYNVEDIMFQRAKKRRR